MQGLIGLGILVITVVCQQFDDEVPIMGLSHVRNNFIVLGKQYLSQINMDEQKVTQVNRITRIESTVFAFQHHNYQFIVTSDAQLMQLDIIQQVTSYKVIDKNTLDDAIDQKIMFATFDSQNQKLVVSTDKNDVLVYDLVQLYNDGENIIIGTRLVQKLGIKGTSINAIIKFDKYLVLGQQDVVKVIDLDQESVNHEWNYLKLNDKEYEYSEIQQMKHLGLQYLIIGYKNGRIIIVDVFIQKIMFYIVNDSPFDVFQVLMTDSQEFYLIVASQNGYIAIYGIEYEWFTKEACRVEIKHSIKQESKSGIKMIDAIDDQLGINLILGYSNSQYAIAFIEGLHTQEINHHDDSNNHYDDSNDQQSIKSDL